MKMPRIQLIGRVALVMSVLACSGKGETQIAPENDELPGATETNFAPVPCDDDGDCPPTVACAPAEVDGGSAGGSALGFCAVEAAGG